MAEKPAPEGINPELRDVVQYTQMIQVKQREIAVISDRRERAVRKHREHGVSYADLAAAMGVSQARLYKIIKGKEDHIPRTGGLPKQPRHRKTT